MYWENNLIVSWQWSITFQNMWDTTKKRKTFAVNTFITKQQRLKINEQNNKPKMQEKLNQTHEVEKRQNSKCKKFKKKNTVNSNQNEGNNSNKISRINKTKKK